MAVSVSRQVLGYPITASAHRLGADWNVSVVGGCAPHIGSVSVAWPDADGIAVATNERPSHREAVVSERFAGELASGLRCCVSVSCGIHYDSPSREELGLIVAETELLLADLLAALSAESSAAPSSRPPAEPGR